jgi:hypothetical protein
MPQAPVPGPKLGLFVIVATSGYLACCLFYCFPSSFNVCIHTHTHTHIYKDTGKLAPLHPCIPVPPTIVSWGPWA